MTWIAVFLFCLAAGVAAAWRQAVADASDAENRRRMAEGEAQAAARDAELQRAALFEAVSDGLFVFDPTGHVLDANPAAERLFHADRATLRGKPRGELVLERLDGAVGVRSDGSTFPIRARSVPLGRAHTLCAIVDLSPMQHLQERLDDNQRMEAVARLAGGVAHVINNQLTVARAGAAHLRDTLPPDGDPAVFGLIEQIVRATVRGSDLTQELLSFGRRQILRSEPVDVAALAERLSPVLEQVVSPRRVVVRVEAGRTVAQTDPTHLGLAIENLVSYRLEAIREAVTVSVSPVGGVEARRRWPEIERSRAPTEPDAWVLVTVEDDGREIPADHLPRLFEPFFTPTGEPGEGVGLAAVQGFVTQCGGHLLVRSRPGEGARFDIVLPCAPQEAAPEPARAEAAPGAPRSGVVLVCDDDPLVRRTVERLIRHAGFSVASADSAATALQRLEQGGVDLLVTDVQMPDRSGVELARIALAQQPDLGVILISGYSSTLTLNELPGRLIAKPFDPEVLITAVREVMGVVRS